MNLPVYSLGISPCPNDTFIFEALVHGRVQAPFTVQTHMADVEELNTLAGQGGLAVTKLSLAACFSVLDKYVLLRSGAALGRGCGPLVVARPGLKEKDYAAARIAIPGRLTTANLLLSLNGAFRGPREEMVFDQVMPALLHGEADLGVIIHEGRFTYEEKGLALVQDLGQWWEKTTGLPLPLGVIAVKRDMAREKALAVEQAIRDSILFSRAHPDVGRPYIRAHAQEMEESVMARHIDTFVNEYSLNLGEEGQNAIIALMEAQAKDNGLPMTPLPVFIS